MIPEELQYVLILLGRLDVTNGKQSLEMREFCPDLMIAQTCALVELMCGSHRMQVDSKHLASASERKVVSQLPHVLERHGLGLQSAILVHFVVIE